jgi:hypothetical protein
MVSIVEPAIQRSHPSTPVGKQLSNNLRIILQMDTTAQSIAFRTITNQTSRRERRRGEIESRERVFPRLLPKRLVRNVVGDQFGFMAVRAFSGLMSSADALARAVRLGESQRSLPVQAIGVQDNSPWQRGSFMGCLVRSRERFPVGQNVGNRDSAVVAALDLFQKADCDRLGDRIARG